jgi:hypothetical protein
MQINTGANSDIRAVDNFSQPKSDCIKLTEFAGILDYVAWADNMVLAPRLEEGITQ